MPAPNMPNLGKTPKSGIAADDTLTAESLPDVFYVIEVDTNRVYVGQQLTAYYVLYSANSVTNYSSLSAPAQQAFWVEDISPNRINTETAVFGNKAFQKYAIKKFALFPQRSGTLEIDEMELEVQARFPLPNGQQRRFRNYTTKTLKVKADSKEVTVLPLPSGAPEDFKGTVGSYKLNVRANKTVCKVGEAIDLNVGILGNGNLKLIEPVQIPTSEDYEIYDPITSENIRADGDLVLGTKTYEYAIIPKKEGTIEIPSLRLTYFNPRTKRYEVKSSQKISVEVIPGDGSGIVELDVKEEKGIMEIKPGIDRLKSKSGSNLPLYVLGGLFLLPFLLMPMVVIRKKKADELKKDVVGNRRNQASTAAQHRLAEAKSYISRKDKKAFYTEITKTIEGYCADKFNMPASSLSKEVIVEQLQSKAIPENTIEELKNILEYCEVVLFAPVADADNLQKTYDATLSVVTELEEHF